MVPGITQRTNIWVNSLLLEDYPETGGALQSCGSFRVYSSNSATGPAKLVIAFGPLADLRDIKCIARILPMAFLLEGVGETDDQSIIFVGIESFNEHQIVAVQEIASAIEAASKIEHIHQAIAAARR